MRITASIKDPIEEGVAVKQKDIQKVCENMISEMKNGLPKEAHTIEVFNYILQECKEMLEKKELKL